LHGRTAELPVGDLWMLWRQCSANQNAHSSSYRKSIFREPSAITSVFLSVNLSALVTTKRILIQQASPPYSHPHSQAHSPGPRRLPSPLVSHLQVPVRGHLLHTRRRSAPPRPITPAGATASPSGAVLLWGKGGDLQRRHEPGKQPGFLCCAGCGRVGRGCVYPWL
jgi:hypothetical protein